MIFRSAPIPSPMPIPEPIVQSLTNALCVQCQSITVKYGEQFRINGVKFKIADMSQVQAVKIGQWTMSGFNVQDDHTIITTVQVSYIGTWDVSIMSLDGTISTLTNGLQLIQ